MLLAWDQEQSPGRQNIVVLCRVKILSRSSPTLNGSAMREDVVSGIKFEMYLPLVAIVTSRIY